MSTMNISLPEPLKRFVDERVANAGYSTSSEYLRELIRHDQDKLLLRSMVLDGASSPMSGLASTEYFADLRAKTSIRLAQ